MEVPPAFPWCSWSLTCSALSLSGYAEGMWTENFILYQPRSNIDSFCPAVEPCEHVQSAQGALSKLLSCCKARARTWVGKKDDDSLNGLMAEFPHKHPSVKGWFSSWKKSLIIQISTQIKAAWNTKLEILWIQTSLFWSPQDNRELSEETADLGSAEHVFWEVHCSF